MLLRQIWPLLGPLLTQIPRELHPALPIALAPVLANPLNLLAASVNPRSSLPEQLSQAIKVNTGSLHI